MRYVRVDLWSNTLPTVESIVRFAPNNRTLRRKRKKKLQIHLTFSFILKNALFHPLGRETVIESVSVNVFFVSAKMSSITVFGDRISTTLLEFVDLVEEISGSIQNSEWFTAWVD